MTSTPQGAAAPAVNSLWRHRVSGTFPHTVVLVAESPSEVLTRSPGGLTSTTPVDAFHDRFEAWEVTADGYRAVGHAPEGLGVLREVQVERDRVIASVVFPRAMGQSLVALCSLKRPVQITVPLSRSPLPQGPLDVAPPYVQAAANAARERHEALTKIAMMVGGDPSSSGEDIADAVLRALNEADKSETGPCLSCANLKKTDEARTAGLIEALQVAPGTPWTSMLQAVRNRLPPDMATILHNREEQLGAALGYGGKEQSGRTWASLLADVRDLAAGDNASHDERMRMKLADALGLTRDPDEAPSWDELLGRASGKRAAIDVLGAGPWTAMQDAFRQVAAALFPEDVDHLMTNTPLGDAVDALVGRVKQLRRANQESVKASMEASMEVAERSRQIARALDVSEAMPWEELVTAVAIRAAAFLRLPDVESARDEAFRMRDEAFANLKAALDVQDARTQADAYTEARRCGALAEALGCEGAAWAELLSIVKATVTRRDQAIAQLEAQLLTVDQTISLAYALGCERVGPPRLGDTMIAVATALKKNAEENGRAVLNVVAMRRAGYTEEEIDHLLDLEIAARAEIKGASFTVDPKAAPPGRFTTPSHVLLEERLATVETSLRVWQERAARTDGDQVALAKELAALGKHLEDVERRAYDTPTKANLLSLERRVDSLAQMRDEAIDELKRRGKFTHLADLQRGDWVVFDGAPREVVGLSPNEVVLGRGSAEVHIDRTGPALQLVWRPGPRE